MSLPTVCAICRRPISGDRSLCERCANPFETAKKVIDADYCPAWIEMLAEQIRSNWFAWEQEAGEIAQNEQDTRAGEAHLFECLKNKIRWVFANHGR